MRHLTAILLALLSLLIVPCCLANPIPVPMEDTYVDEWEWVLVIVFLAASPALEALIVVLVLWRDEAKMKNLFGLVVAVNIATILMSTMMFYAWYSEDNILLSYGGAEVVPVGIEIALLAFIVPRLSGFKEMYRTKQLVMTILFANLVTFILGIFLFAYLNEASLL